MKLKFSKKVSNRVKARLKNKARIRKKVIGSTERPRLTVYRSSKHIYAQIVDDSTGSTLCSASSLAAKLEGANSSKNAAFEVGKLIAETAKGKNISKVVFDRSGYIYHGRIRSLAEGAREGGLNF